MAKIERLGSGKFLELVKDGKWEFVNRINASGVVAIVAVTERDELVLTEQYRPAVRKRVVDVPAGLAGDIKGQETEGFIKAAHRELLEETGFKAGSMQLIFTGPSSPGMTSEQVNFFLTKNVKQVSAGGGDESEDIKVHLVPLGKIKKWLSKKSTRRTCVDVKVFTALGILNVYADGAV